MDRVFAGLDCSGGASRVTVALLDGRPGKPRLQSIPASEAEAMLLGLDRVSVALGGPVHLPSPKPPEQSGTLRAKWDVARSSERELHRRGIPTRLAPENENAAPFWMRIGAGIARDLFQPGFVDSTEANRDNARLLLESHPLGCFTALLGRSPFGRNTLEGRLQRQLVLIRERVDLPDPLEAMEELTAHHLLAGRVPLSGLCLPCELDALAGAFTAWLAWHFPARVEWLGDGEKDRICLPCPQNHA
jgi:hypothetical protein